MRGVGWDCKVLASQGRTIAAQPPQACVHGAAAAWRHGERHSHAPAALARRGKLRVGRCGALHAQHRNNRGGAPRLPPGALRSSRSPARGLGRLPPYGGRRAAACALCIPALMPFRRERRVYPQRGLRRARRPVPPTTRTGGLPQRQAGAGDQPSRGITRGASTGFTPCGAPDPGAAARRSNAPAARVPRPGDRARPGLRRTRGLDPCSRAQFPYPRSHAAGARRSPPAVSGPGRRGQLNGDDTRGARRRPAVRVAACSRVNRGAEHVLHKVQYASLHHLEAAFTPAPPRTRSTGGPPAPPAPDARRAEQALLWTAAAAAARLRGSPHGGCVEPRRVRSRTSACFRRSCGCSAP